MNNHRWLIALFLFVFNDDNANMSLAEVSREEEKKRLRKVGFRFCPLFSSGRSLIPLVARSNLPLSQSITSNLGLVFINSLGRENEIEKGRER